MHLLIMGDEGFDAWGVLFVESFLGRNTTGVIGQVVEQKISDTFSSSSGVSWA